MIYFSFGIILIVFCVDILCMNSIHVHLCKSKEKYKKQNQLSSAISIFLLAINGVLILANEVSDVLMFYNMLTLVVCAIKNILSIESFKKFKVSSEEYFFEDDTTSENTDAIVIEADEEDYGL